MSWDGNGWTNRRPNLPPEERCAVALERIADALDRMTPEPNDPGPLAHAFPGLRDAAEQAAGLTVRSSHRRRPGA